MLLQQQQHYYLTRLHGDLPGSQATCTHTNAPCIASVYIWQRAGVYMNRSLTPWHEPCLIWTDTYYSAFRRGDKQCKWWRLTDRYVLASDKYVRTQHSNYGHRSVRLAGLRSIQRRYRINSIHEYSLRSKIFDAVDFFNYIWPFVLFKKFK